MGKPATSTDTETQQAGNGHLAREAKAWLADRERDIRRGEWINPTDSQTTLDTYWGTYIQAAQTPGTRQVREQVRANLSYLADMPLETIRPALIRARIATLQNGRPWADGKPLSRMRSVGTPSNYPAACRWLWKMST